ncbi:putative GTP-binding protein YjiA [Limihaloglobus sulfuriphilus]|uniref:Putative GTP-binding protein YjiA n=1 Tax=Limihaloglobus sulfuriphilus TaxID=1851148 RepID=A0A1Q2MEH9_9BACT|nr:CobW family GTP-binding protein [Limihaloglobus sulfuriphilus]AQQ71105.1 putative GTP-binding protein YjiA [Limihaloglobus sulfuriphilus]
MAIPIWTLTGYLGAGKTTTLNKMLETPAIKDKKLALIINEFGKLGVDGSLVKPGDYAKYEINKGSIFCICTKTDFIKALTEISQSSIEAVVVEATGIAETRDIQGFIQEPYLKGQFEIKANICIVDAVNFTKTAPFLKPVTGQLAWADLVVINKVDLINGEELERLKEIIAGYNKEAPVVTASYGEFEPSALDNIKHIVRGGDMATEPPADIIAVAVKNSARADRQKFMSLIDQLSENILRLKGNIEFTDKSSYVEIVGKDLFERPRQENLSQGSAFTVIAWKLDKETLTDRFGEIFKD